MIRVAVADEHRIIRWALREALAKAHDLELVGEAGTVEDTLTMIRRDKPDVLLLNTAMPDHSGFDLLVEIRQIETGPLVIVLAPHTDARYAARTLAKGAHGYVSMSAEPNELIDAIRAVHGGEQIIPAGVEKLLIPGDGHPASALTTREQQVMELLGRGLTSHEIAEHLDISVKTVDTHRGHVLKKLGLRNNSELTRFAVKHGYVTL
ncbi:MAG TPA: response regulator transcription factor [Kofleriaceae bacterium]|jgi:DNA-binding NarL/FixJ family response regulator|nr:response regulator transcription factor [Kofleriaceae bacterium]